MAYDLSGFVTKTQAAIAALPSAPEPKNLLLIAKAIEATTPTVAISDLLAASTSQQAIITAQGTAAIGAINDARDDAIEAIQQAGQGSAAASGISFAPTGAIGATNVQSAIAELDAEKQPLATALTAIGALAPAADRLPYFTGTGAGALATFTVAARALLDDPDGPTMLGTLGALARAGDTMTGSLTLSGDPTAALHAATKQYVDNLVQGLDAKASVRVASTGNLTLSGLQTIDGIAVAAGERVLMKDQTTASQNGLYVAASGAWARAPDADVWNELPSAFVLVESGTVNADTGWVCTSDVGGTLGTTAVTWVKFGTLAGLAALASPAFTGTPTAPTAAQGTNSTQLATLAFVIAEIAARLPAYATTADIWAGTDTGKIVTAKALRDAQVPQTLTASATPAWNAALGFNAKITLTANTTFQTPTNLVEGLTYVLRAKQDTTGGRTGSYTSAFNFGADGAPTLSTAANAEDVLTFLCVDAATPRLSFVGIKKGV